MANSVTLGICSLWHCVGISLISFAGQGGFSMEPVTLILCLIRKNLEPQRSVRKREVLLHLILLNHDQRPRQRDLCLQGLGTMLISPSIGTQWALESLSYRYIIIQHSLLLIMKALIFFFFLPHTNLLMMVSFEFLLR